MRPWMAFALAALGCAVTFSVSSASAASIRIRVDQIKGQFTVTGIGLRFPGSASAHDGGMSLGFRALRVRSSLASHGLKHWEVKDRDSGAVLSSFNARKFEIAGMSLRVNLKSVPDRLSFLPSRLGSDLIATMDLEDYLQGVLPAEMPKNWPIEALKAQAVAARTFALYKISLRRDADYDVESDVMDQVFQNPLHSPGTLQTNAAVAVRETRGTVLLNRRGEALAAYFHADCGGHTEEAPEVWAGAEKQGTVKDDACPLNPVAHWRAEFGVVEVMERLRSVAMAPHPDARIAKLETVDHTASGRVAHLKLTWTDGSSAMIAAPEFRMAMGHDKVKSTNFQVEMKAREGMIAGFSFSGVGFGHGVGMCQWGAKHLALGGAFYSEILQHYYPRAVLREAATGMTTESTARSITETKRL